MNIPIAISNDDTVNQILVELKALVDSGAGGVFMDQIFARNKGYRLQKLPEPMPVYNVDGTPNKKGTITHYVELPTTIGGRTRPIRYLITGLGKQKVIFGFTWLQEENPDIDWQQGTLRWRKPFINFWNKKKLPPSMAIEEEEDFEGVAPLHPEFDLSAPIIQALETGTDTENEWNESEVWINAKTTASQTFAQQAHESVAAKPLEEAIPKEYHNYLDLFDEKTADRLPDPKAWDHEIKLKPDFVPKSFKAYNLTPQERTEMSAFIKENLRKGYIRPSQSPMASPFFFVSKKDGKLRPCQDYRYLNNGTIKNAYPLPLISELLDKLKGAKYFTKLDVRWGYNNIRIKEGDQWKAAFKTPDGLFEPTVMFFGMCNSPATFQNMMDDIFQTLREKGGVIIYMDDILIFAPTSDKLEQLTKEVLEILRRNDLFLKPEKCAFKQLKIDYLGMIIEEGKISMDPAKLKGIADWPIPTTVKEVRSFLGFGNFYRKFIRQYSNITRPLNELLRKDQKFEWTTECDEAFNTLKRLFTEEPVLMMPDSTRPFQIEADASKYASGAVLTQLDTNGSRHPVAFFSKTFSEAERNYEIYDRELLAMIRALEEWRHYIQGSPHTTTVYSDHKNLTYFRGPQKLNRRQARWTLTLSEYDIHLVHVPGSQMVQSDALSRRPDLCPETDDDNKDITLLPEGLFIRLIDTELQERILGAKKMDFDAADAIKLLFEDTPDARRDMDSWTVETKDGQNMLFYKGKAYIPDDLELRREVVRKHHDVITAGHPGELATFNSIADNYYWPGMRTFVKKYVKGCAECQQFKINRNPTKVSLNPIPASGAKRPFAQISWDLITDLPKSGDHKYDSILVVVDHGLTKGVILTPCKKTIKADGVADILLRKIYTRFGLPDKIISDRDPRFTAHAFQELLKRLEIQSAMSTTAHPQTDGATERSNQEIEAYLSIYCTLHPETWSQALPILEFTYNNRRHADRTQTPFELIMGTAPKAIPEAFDKSSFPSTNERLKSLNEARSEALAAHELARRRMLERGKYLHIPFEKGQKVWLEARNLTLPYQSKKIAPKREGPFTILDVLSPLNYRLKLPPKWKIHDVFHASLLTPFNETEVHGPAFPQPPPEEISGNIEWEPEAILKHTGTGKNMLYRVHWKGYPSSEDTNEPKECFKNALPLLNAYRRKHKLSAFKKV